MMGNVRKAKWASAKARLRLGRIRRAMLRAAAAGALGTSLMLGLAAGASAVAGCANQQTVLLRMQGEQTDALVTINDRYVGKLGEIVRRGIRLPPGPYRITIEQVGYFNYDELIQVQDEPVNLSVKLVPVPD